MLQRRIKVTIHLAKGYIAHPYWPEREDLINLQKVSGMNRARSEARRQAALAETLKRMGMDEESYADLVQKADRAWYRIDNDDESTEIIIPSHQLYGCFIETAKTCTAALRPCDPENIRHMLAVSDFFTGKVSEDGVFRRLVMPKSGTGQPLSNQRSLRENPFIADVTASGSVAFYPDDLRDKGDYVEDFLSYAGQRVGVGTSRKMGYGRFTVTSYLAENPEAPEE